MTGEFNGKFLIRDLEKNLTVFDVELWLRDGRKFLIDILRVLGDEYGKIIAVRVIFVDTARAGTRFIARAGLKLYFPTVTPVFP